MSHGYGQGYGQRYMDHRRVVWITALLVSLASIARADDTGDTPCTIPMRVDWSSWLRAGGGVTVAHPTREAARATGTSSSGVFDLGLGFEGMIAVGGKRVRLGPWGQVSTWSFRNVAPVGGVELMLSSPLARYALHWFAQSDRAIGLGLRGGIGWSFAFDDASRSAALYEATLTIGIRTYEMITAEYAPAGRCRFPDDPETFSDAPHFQFYSFGARGFVTARRIMTDDREWQFVAGIEIEPVTLVILPHQWRHRNDPSPAPW
jgi:hypothetical protein